MAIPSQFVGQTIAHYRIIEKVGEGGMGLVYKAHDTRLDRTVAIKVLRADKISDPERKRRFVQEAKAASSLNHPNIITIYDIGQAEGIDFISMEYVNGKTLDRLIQRHGMRLTEALKCGVQVADALARAHSAGIIHRDLKPGNIMVNEHGLVKVLDFGLAKLTESTPTAEDESTRTMRLTTEEGKIVGTVAYMSPEQAEGKKVDARSDIFSFGSVLYEMVTGRQAFQGDTRASTLAAILRDNPPPTGQLVDGLPREVERLIERCLRKEINQRSQHMDDVKIGLQELKEESDSGVLGTAAVPTAKPRRRLGWLLGAGCAAPFVAIVLAFWLTRPLPPPKVLGSVRITNDARQKTNPMVTDGARIYFSEALGNGLVLAQISTSGGETAIIPTSLQDPTILDISPTHSELLLGKPSYLGDSQLTVLPVPAGSPHRLANVIAHDGTWSPDGQRIVYASGSGLYSARTDGSEPQKIVSVAGSVTWPRWSLDGRTLRFTVFETTGTSLWEVRANGTDLHPLLPGWNNPGGECCGNWTADGKYFVFQSTRAGRNDIWAIRERSRSRTTVQPIQLTSGPMDTVNPVPSTDGKKLFVIGGELRGELARYDWKSEQFIPYFSGISAEWVDFSRDGKWIVYATYPEHTLWRSKIDGSERLQLTYPPMLADLPHWSPDGKRIAFAAAQPAKPLKIYIVSVDGGMPQLATSEQEESDDPAWSPDGNSLAFGSGFPGATMSIHVLDISSQRLTTLPGSEGLFAPRWSPDGRYIVAQPLDQQKLFLFDTSTKKWAELVDLPAAYYQWSHDSKFVYFDIDSADEPFICRVRVSDRKIERVVNLKGHRRTGTFGNWMGLTPDDSPLVLLDVGIQEIYALDWEAP